jgi:hypothetical protein
LSADKGVGLQKSFEVVLFIKKADLQIGFEVLLQNKF